MFSNNIIIMRKQKINHRFSLYKIDSRNKWVELASIEAFGERGLYDKVRDMLRSVPIRKRRAHLYMLVYFKDDIINRITFYDSFPFDPFDGIILDRSNLEFIKNLICK